MGAPPFALDRDKVRDNPCAKHTLKDYIIIEELFRSNTGAVYKVRRRSDKKILVLKERRVAELGKRAPADHEANLLRRVGRHPHLIGCHGHFWERARLYVVLDYAAGGDLAQLLKRRTLGDRAYFLPEDWVWLAFEQVCRGLLALHEQKVVHRDIKALNVLVSPTSREVFEERGVPRGLAPLPKDPNLRVADLGVSRECSENTIMLRTMFGTPLYASPEICDGTPYDAKTDVWSLGVVLYELCALQPPFTANNLVALAKTIKAGAFEPLGDHYSSLLKEVVSRDATPRSRTPPAPLIPGPARRPSEESLPNYNAPFAKRGHTPAWRVDVGQTTNEKERSNARLERLRRRGAARRARLEAQVEAAAEPESILVA